MIFRVSSSCTSQPVDALKQEWVRIQDSLSVRVVMEDYCTWMLTFPLATDLNPGERYLKYLGGVDVSYSKDDPEIACAAIVVLDFFSLEVVYSDYSVCRLQIPYAPGFLAFREASLILELLKKMQSEANPCYPQLLLVDGNGVLHPRGCGLACHIGVMADLPTVGVGKNLYHVDGLTKSGVQKHLKSYGNNPTPAVFLIGNSGRTLGVALRPKVAPLKPIFISVGHLVSLNTAVSVVEKACKFRVPEPIRQADIRSRAYLAKHLTSALQEHPGISVNWIPRYANQCADAVCKLKGFDNSLISPTKPPRHLVNLIRMERLLVSDTHLAHQVMLDRVRVDKDLNG